MDFLFFVLNFIIILFINSKELNDPNEKLLFVWEHFRHGARQPYSSFDDINWKDILNENWNGYGELTSLGMRMHYLLGISTKEKYKYFINEYNPNEILIRSTDVNRTILSAFATLQGLYNDSNYILNDEQIKRSIIQNKNYSEEINNLKNSEIEGERSFFPVHVFPTNYDHQYQLFWKNECPGIEKYINEIKNSSEYINLTNEICERINNTYGKYIFKFMNKSGIEEPNYLYDFNNLFSIADTFVADYFNGKDLKYINDTGINMDKFYNECLNISSIDSYYRTFGLTPSKLLYISISPAFISLFNYMDMRIDFDKKGESEKIVAKSPKFVLMAGHDNSLGLNDLFLKYKFNINYDKAVYSHNQVYELWKNEKENKYYIKYLVNFDQKGVFDYEEFKKKVNSKIYSSEQIEEICNGNKN